MSIVGHQNSHHSDINSDINSLQEERSRLMESLHLEKSQIYNLRARAGKKLLRLSYGACAGE